MSTDGRDARLWLALGALNGFLAVALGAFAAHGLEGRLSERFLNTFQKAVDYQGMHAFALLAVGLLLWLRPGFRLLNWAGRLFLAGILLFSGSLYILALSGVTLWGMVTPFGGTAFLLGWLILALAAWRLEPGN
jgi:uncharacterized membrane protein YgdD (TMEM256/DUF423 family)